MKFYQTKIKRKHTILMDLMRLISEEEDLVALTLIFLTQTIYLNTSSKIISLIMMMMLIFLVLSLEKEEVKIKMDLNMASDLLCLIMIHS